ncbi:hypothetical protein FM107_02690 [Sphingobacterium sp. JB170]|nr:hypothetical protein FM107_02690 [Sphingobacterium sp. JB170]
MHPKKNRINFPAKGFHASAARKHTGQKLCAAVLVGVNEIV